MRTEMHAITRLRNTLDEIDPFTEFARKRHRIRISDIGALLDQYEAYRAEEIALLGGDVHPLLALLEEASLALRSYTYNEGNSQAGVRRAKALDAISNFQRRFNPSVAVTTRP